MGSLYERTNATTKPISSEEILLKTLDAYCQEKNIQKIDYLKIDVEGHEFSVLKGGINLLQKKSIKIIQFEYGGSHIDSRTYLKDFFELLEPFDYQFYKITPKIALHVPKYKYELDNFQYSNWLAVQKSTNFIP